MTAPASTTNTTAVIDADHLAHQREWSLATFGPAKRTLGVLDHIRKELAEIEADPDDLGEWVDVIILAFDGAWRRGWEPQQIIDAIKAKQAKNEARTWPNWRGRSEDEAIEHDRNEARTIFRPGDPVPAPWATYNARIRANRDAETYRQAEALATLPRLEVGDYLADLANREPGSLLCAHHSARLAIAVIDHLERRGPLHALTAPGSTNTTNEPAEALRGAVSHLSAALRATADEHVRMASTVAPSAPAEAERLRGIADGLRLAADVMLREVTP